MEKTQERIISQKNEQIRKISQEVKKTRSELKRRKREEIVEIPVLPENTSNDLQVKEARDIFFYDIPKYWSEEDVRTNLIKIGMVFRLQQTSKTAFIKIIKITKNWKVIGYFKNLKEMEKAVEDSCTQEDINRVWLVRNKKMIYKYDDDKSRMKKLNEKVIQDKETAMKPGLGSPLRTVSEPKTPMTPPERIYRELGNFASRKDNLLHPSKEEKPIRTNKTLDEEVADMIKNWRVREEDTPDHNDKSENKRMQSHLKKDNVAPEEVGQT
ncbi:hypothetical protein RhiirC2_721700 [Rhizophagus irregularis]|uniref:Uncharacterized protein n=1 Tax=Rhizophagus irregularis TaxID=588596 RepID=A0A2N1M543_9GLOM|nr:hypothetical protein RhiirC2_721700 [Rhizophagus irregularis]